MRICTRIYVKDFLAIEPTMASIEKGITRLPYSQQYFNAGHFHKVLNSVVRIQIELSPIQEKLKSIDSAMGDQQVIFSIQDKIYDCEGKMPYPLLPEEECTLEFFINEPGVGPEQNNKGIQSLWIRYLQIVDKPSVPKIIMSDTEIVTHSQLLLAFSKIHDGTVNQLSATHLQLQQKNDVIPLHKDDDDYDSDYDSDY